jgi:hypothetical protein
MPHPSLGGASYFVTFIEDATQKVWAYPTWTKDRVFTIFKAWLAMVKAMFTKLMVGEGELGNVAGLG